MRQLLFITALIHGFLACNPQKEDRNPYQIAMVNDSTKVELALGSTNKLICSVADSVTSEWPLRYPVYQYQYGDINHDGSTDLAVGVYKATRYDSIRRNRLFLFQVRRNAIIPLWLGTSIGHPIVDFRMRQGQDGTCFLRVMGKEKDGKYLVADYDWYGFGLALLAYVKREATMEIAKKLLED